MPKQRPSPSASSEQFGQPPLELQASKAENHHNGDEWYGDSHVGTEQGRAECELELRDVKNGLSKVSYAIVPRTIEFLTATRLAGKNIDPRTAMNFMSSLSRCVARAMLDWTLMSRWPTRL